MAIPLRPIRDGLLNALPGSCRLHKNASIFFGGILEYVIGEVIDVAFAKVGGLECVLGEVRQRHCANEVRLRQRGTLACSARYVGVREGRRRGRRGHRCSRREV